MILCLQQKRQLVALLSHLLGIGQDSPESLLAQALMKLIQAVHVHFNGACRGELSDGLAQLVSYASYLIIAIPSYSATHNDTLQINWPLDQTLC